MAQITDLASAIARFENVNPAYNNPGGIWDNSANTIKTFPSYQDGWNALVNTVNNYVGRGVSLEEMMGRYALAGHGDNNPSHYADVLAGWLGIPKDQPLNAVLGSTNSPQAPTFSATTTGGGGGEIENLFLSTTVVGPGLNIPNWLIIGIGVGSLVWLVKR